MMKTWGYLARRVNRRTASAALLIGAAVPIFFLIRGFSAAEPAYQGFSLTTWLNQVNGTNRELARIALREMGPSAAPFLLRKIRREDPLEDRIHRRIYPLLPPSVQAKLPYPKSREANVVHQTACELAQLGASTAPRLIRALRDRDDFVRAAAYNALGRLGPGAEAAIPTLTKLLIDPTPLLRERVSVRFAIHPSTSQRDSSDMIHGLRLVDSTKAAAAWTLGSIGPKAHSSLPKLLEMLSDSDANARQEAALALWRIGGLTNGLETLISDLQGLPEWPNYYRMVTGLGEMGPLAKPAVPTLLATASQGTDISWLVEPVLNRIDPEAAAALAARKVVEPGN